MGHSPATRAISQHLWNHHNRTKAEGTQLQRELEHEELHATTTEGLDHSHGPNGEFYTTCACGHTHECTVLNTGKD